MGIANRGLLFSTSAMLLAAAVCTFRDPISHRYIVPIKLGYSTSSAAASLESTSHGRLAWDSSRLGLFGSDQGNDQTRDSAMTHGDAVTTGMSDGVTANGAVIDPLSDFIYSGTVHHDGSITALIEQRSTRNGWYVNSGEPWNGYQILDITDQAVTLFVDGKKRLLAKSNAINLVPFTAGAEQTAQTFDVVTDNSTDQNIVSFALDYLGADSSNQAAIEGIKDRVFDGDISVEQGDEMISQQTSEQPMQASIYFDVPMATWTTRTVTVLTSPTAWSVRVPSEQDSFSVTR